jgi:aconitate hydratase
MAPSVHFDSFGARTPMGAGHPAYYRLDALEPHGYERARCPVTVKILIENVLRHAGGGIVTRDDVLALAAWRPGSRPDIDMPFMPARVLLQDFTGVPAVVDLAAMRDAMVALGSDPARVNPLVPADLVIDHSVQVDRAGDTSAFAFNVEREYERNGERYRLLRWAQGAFRGLRVVPPGTGIVHQVNLEYLASVVTVGEDAVGPVAHPDTLVGTDSHTTMINGLGVLGYGVGGIEAEAVLLGQPLYLPLPRVVGVRLEGRVRHGVTATDLVLTITERLRSVGVVGSFVEFAGDGLAGLSLPDRATVANMSPEFGATAALFPIDDETIAYLRLTGRDGALVDRVERYARLQGLWRDPGVVPEFDALVEIDLAGIDPSVAGPRRPQDRLSLAGVPASVRDALERAGGDDAAPPGTIDHGSVVIAAITSCTNTSNPSVMVAAGLLARNAVARGLRVPPTVKTSLAPGSRAVMRYLAAAGLVEPLEMLGFNLVGYGCTTCIGNSGPLDPAIAKAVEERSLLAAAVLSGNRNFEGRVHPLARLSYLASPPLVVAYALAGTVNVDLATEPLGVDRDGRPVLLSELWPTADELRDTLHDALGPDVFRETYADVFEGDEHWRSLAAPEGDRYAWEVDSTYIARPPFFEPTTGASPDGVADIVGARVLAVLGDSVTTDHISPAGSIPAWSPAGQWLVAHGVAPHDFNSYGARRGHHEIMMRGTFGSIRLRNRLVEREGPWTEHQPSGETLFIYDAAARYRAEAVPLIVIAGREYGSGSSRDWAAKGPRLLGVRAVIAESFERIHRSNLVGMGILPLEFPAGESASSLGLTGREAYAIRGMGDQLRPRGTVTIETKVAGDVRSFPALVRLDGPIDLGYYRNGGILPAVLHRLTGRA